MCVWVGGGKDFSPASRKHADACNYRKVETVARPHGQILRIVGEDELEGTFRDIVVMGNVESVPEVFFFSVVKCVLLSCLLPQHPACFLADERVLVLRCKKKM